MFTKIDKAWTAGLVAFISLSAMTFFGVELSDQVQAGLVSLLSFGLTWLVPNKA
jgi:hypothetical protein